jgi:dCTP diphosphatase
MAAQEVSFETLVHEIRTFVEERDWDRFHTIKDLAIGLAIEAGELQEQTLWRSPEEIEEALSSDPSYREAVLDEIADVLFFALRLCDKLGVAPGDILPAKIEKNRIKYPVERARGRATKYTAWEKDDS